MLAGTAWSQTGLTLTTSNGAQHHYNIERSGAIYMDNDQLEIRENLNNGAHDYFNMAEVRKITFDKPLSIDALQQNQILLYPNPASTHIVLRGIEEQSKVQILDAMGRIVTEQKRSDNEQINIAQLAPGVYVVRVKDQLIKFIKQ